MNNINSIVNAIVAGTAIIGTAIVGRSIIKTIADRKAKHININTEKLSDDIDMNQTDNVVNEPCVTKYSKDFDANQVEMREILKEISQNFLIGDIGISTNNYVNWGLRSDGSIAILDILDK